MTAHNKKFKEQVTRNLDISTSLQKEPWRAAELDRDPKVLAAVIAYHADFIPGGGLSGGRQPSATRQALRAVIDAELARRAGRSQSWLTFAGFAVSFAGFALAAVQLWVASQ